MSERADPDSAEDEERPAESRPGEARRARSGRGPRGWRRSIPSRDRGPLIVLAIAMAISAALILWETRGTTFFNDEFILFERFDGGFDPETLLTPFNGHLIAVGSFIFEAALSLFGPSTVPFKLTGIAMLCGLSAVLYVYLSRRVSAWLALVPPVILLFCGASWEVLLWPMSNINTCLSVGAGLAAMLAVESDRRRSDLAACLLLILGLLAGTYALAFLVGVIVAIVAQPGRTGRAWVALVPLTLYAGWWIWSQHFPQEDAVELANLWLIPSFSLGSLAVVLAAMTGLAASLTGQGVNPTIAIDDGWGKVLAVAAVVAVGWRLSRGRMPPGFWPSVAALITFWALVGLSFGPVRTPEESRYILPGVVLVAMVAGNALAGVRIPRPAAIAVAVVTVMAIATGIRQIHDGGLFLRDYSDRARATLTGLEEAANPKADYIPRYDYSLGDVVPSQLAITTGPYLESVREFGSPAFSNEELREQSAAIQDIAKRARTSATADAAGVPPPGFENP